jgi:hypothetical protein
MGEFKGVNANVKGSLKVIKRQDRQKQKTQRQKQKTKNKKQKTCGSISIAI